MSGSIRLFGGIPWLDEAAVRFQSTEPAGLRLTVSRDRSYRRVLAHLAFPFSAAQQIVEVSDLLAGGTMVGIIRDALKLDLVSLAVLARYVQTRYCLPNVASIVELTRTDGTSHCLVKTDSGAKSFSVRHIPVGTDPYDHRRAVISGDDGSCFLIKDLLALDSVSLCLLEEMGAGETHFNV